MSDAEATATQTAIINKGHLLKHGATEHLLQIVEGMVWQWVIPSMALTTIKQQYLISSTARRSDGVHVRVVAEASPAADARSVAPTLEDAYLYLISSANRSTGPAKPETENGR